MSGAEDWEAVGLHVRARMTERKVTTAELARVTAVSETTIRSVRKGTGPHRKYMLVAISAALGWPPRYLHEVLAGSEEELTPGTPHATDGLHPPS